ncbi:Uncharacterised protein [Cedecea lapagei]|uniref:Eaa1 n=1 Tax=Cedecea lapagei TaxID=158823 RepID=A0A447V2B3_9ENTR|nr:hypothetical protein [Cedecea lapagei]VEB97390.1 Uncharacterised protein [Cedecea lapagei]
MNNLSNDRLAEYANDKRMCNVSDEIVSMARELLALREAGKEPFGYTDGPRHGMCYEPRHAERLMDAHPLYAAPQLPVWIGVDWAAPAVPEGWVMVPVEPTEDMIINGFESRPDESFSDEKEWEAYEAMSGCQQAAHRAKLCWAAMIAAAPKPE